jgi:hypothetical protein
MWYDELLFETNGLLLIDKYDSTSAEMHFSQPEYEFQERQPAHL